jgi:hypothetical protein
MLGGAAEGIQWRACSGARTERTGSPGRSRDEDSGYAAMSPRSMVDAIDAAAQRALLARRARLPVRPSDSAVDVGTLGMLPQVLGGASDLLTLTLTSNLPDIRYDV